MVSITRLRLVTLLTLAFSAGLPAFPTRAIAQVPHGVFSLSGTGQAAGPIALANPDVVGISVRQGWTDLEPTEGNFNWTFLDSEVATAAAAGKQILLRI